MVNKEIREEIILGMIDRPYENDEELYYLYFEGLIDDWMPLLGETRQKNNHKEFLYLFGIGKLGTWLNDTAKMIGENLNEGKEFLIEKSLSIDYMFNEVFQKTETDYIEYSEQQAENFEKAMSGDAPNFKYNTQRDDRVRLSHQMMEGVILPKNDPYWDTHTPPLGINCRCFLTETWETITSPVMKKKIKVRNEMSFDFNSAKEPYVFPLDHNYLNYVDGRILRKFINRYEGKS